MREGGGSTDLFFQPCKTRIPLDDLTMGVSDIARGLGYGVSAHEDTSGPADAAKRSMPPHIAREIEALLGRCQEWLEPRCVWNVLPLSFDDGPDVLVGRPPQDRKLAVGRLIRGQLKGSVAAAAFVVTIGARLETEARAMMAAGQPFEGYVLDTIGSIAVEAAADVMERRIADQVSARGWCCTNRFSPGYCTWPTKGQQALFSLFPARPAGVSLNDSSLMSPIKSVSGVIGLGEGVEHRPYPCDLCALTTCHQRLTEARL